ncbi:hypothetical protein QCA50_018997 [Cerrena zonata]|uniref:Uncharacterized protein n=1 Tax=Cerrena zonata TaxID=2478898 RepID=A0AAW0FC13_9APHY
MQKFFGKNVKKNKLKHAAPRRVPEPPSPGSFTTPEFVVDGSAEGSSIHSSNEHPGPHVPPLKLDFENRDSLSEWFPPSMLKVGDIFNPPHRDASLRPPEPLDRPLWNISREKISFSTDDVIIIEPERPMPPLPTEVESEPENSNKLTDSRDASPGPSLSRRPVPNPIQIPFNPTVSRVRIHRSPSVGANSSPFARTRGDGPSRGASRPVSSYSDEMSSAVSGTTLARDLGSFIITGNSRDSRYRYTLTRQDSATLPKGEHPFMNGSSSSYWKDKRISNGEVILSPEYALGSPVPPVPPIPSSAELSAMAINSATSSKRNSRRRNSIGGEDVAAAQRDQEILEDVSDKASASASRHRRANSLSRISKDQMPINPNRFSKISEASNSPTTPAKSSYSAINSVKSLRESYKRGHTFEDVSKPKPPSTTPSHPESQSEPEPRSSSETANESISSHPETSASVLSPDPPTTGESGSMYSMSSMGRSYTTPGTSIKSPGSAPLYPNSATSAESRLPRRSPSEPLLSGGSDRSRPTILLPHGDRPYTQVPQTASPLSSRTSDESMRDMRLPFRPRGSPGVPAVTPVDSPDLIELMFGGVVQRRPLSQAGRKSTAPYDLFA